METKLPTNHWRATRVVTTLQAYAIKVGFLALCLRKVTFISGPAWALGSASGTLRGGMRSLAGSSRAFPQLGLIRSPEEPSRASLHLGARRDLSPSGDC